MEPSTVTAVGRRWTTATVGVGVLVGDRVAVGLRLSVSAVWAGKTSAAGVGVAEAIITTPAIVVAVGCGGAAVAVGMGVVCAASGGESCAVK